MPSPVCTCGHVRLAHHGVPGARVCRVLDCSCEAFRPAKAAARCEWCDRRAAFRFRVLLADGGTAGRWACELHASEVRKLRVVAVDHLPVAERFT